MYHAIPSTESEHYAEVKPKLDLPLLDDISQLTHYMHVILKWQWKPTESVTW